MQWRETCDTLHAHTQVLGKLAAKLAPPEPELQHAALRLTARGWETAPLPAPDGSGSLVVALDLRVHEALVEHSTGRTEHIPLTPDRAVGSVTRDVLAAVRRVAGGDPGALLLLSVFGRNAASLSGRLGKWLPERAGPAPGHPGADPSQIPPTGSTPP